METARVQESCLPSGVWRCSSNITQHKIPPVKSGELGVPEGPPCAVLRQIQGKGISSSGILLVL